MINKQSHISTRKKSPVWVYRRSKEDDEIKLETWKWLQRKINDTQPGYLSRRTKTHKRQLTGRCTKMAKRVWCVLAHLSLFSGTNER